MRKKDISIIVVDDLQFSREVVKSGLTKSGYSDIRTASAADEALYELNQRRADVVLADFWMPGMNGLEMTDLIRRWDENNDRYTGIVLLTAEDTASSIVVAFDRGVDDFISKSANQFELAARVFGAGRNAFQQNEQRERTRRLSAQLLEIKQNSLQDPQTHLPNRVQFELHIEPDRDLAARYDISANQLAQVVGLTYRGQRLRRFRTEDGEREMRMTLDDAVRFDGARP